MSIPYSEESYSHINPSAHIENTTPQLTVAITSPSAMPTHSYLPTPDGNLEGLGICCGSAGLPVAHDSAIDVAYDNFLWQAQIDNQILQFQQIYEQKLYQSVQGEAPSITADATYACVSVHSTGSAEVVNRTKQQDYDALYAPTSDIEKPSTAGLGPCPPARQGLESFSTFAPTVDHEICSTYHAQPDQTSQQATSSSITTQCPGQRNSIAYQDTAYDLSTMFTTPYLQPSANIQDKYSRRLSVSSNAPSSAFSSDCQGTPYFVTPCATPRFASSISMDLPCTPMSILSSPLHPSHSRSLSSTSLKTPTCTYRPVRPAPYTLDPAQRQRWLTGKTMSLPSRRTQPPDFSFSPGHMRAMSEQNVDGMYFDDDFASDQRASFNKDLEIIRQRLPAVTPSIEGNDGQNSIIKTEATSACSQRPVLAAIQPKILAPISTLSQPRIPPLDLPEQPSRPVSPPAEDLSPSNGAAPTLNPVSPHDVYTPKYKRGTKGQLEGFCGLCKPGRWLNMKNSKYWYDKNYNHGINSKTRKPFDLPVDRRYKMGHSVIRQGLCGVCNQWIDMDTCKKSWKHWWKHAYKCHNKINNFDYEMDENDDPQVLSAGQQQDAITLNDVETQYMQQAEYKQQSWPYPPDQFVYGPEFVMASLQG